MSSFTQEQRQAIELLHAERNELQLNSVDDLRSERLLWSAGLLIAFALGFSTGRHGWFGALFAAAILAALLVYGLIAWWLERRKTDRFMKELVAAAAARSDKKPPTAP
jgi:hypothetical protein